MAEDEAYKKQIERLKRRVAELERQVHTDELTNILNRRGLMQLLDAYVHEVDFQLKHPDRRQFLIIKSLSIIFVDIDFFKKINDQHGHEVGDEVLRQVAQTLRDALRGIDVVGRYGGEELVIGLVGADLDRARVIAEDLRSRVEQTEIQAGDQKLHVTASFGVSTMQTGLSREELLKQADEALYKAKADGRNRVEVYGTND